MNLAPQLFTENVFESVEETVDGSTSFHLVCVYPHEFSLVCFYKFWEFQNIDFGFASMQVAICQVLSMS